MRLDKLENPLSLAVLEGTYAEGNTITVTVKEGQLVLN